jgi:hypothetical protein
MATPASELSRPVPGAPEQLPRNIRQLLIARLRHARELHDQHSKKDHRRLYLACQALCWVALPGLVVLIATSFSERSLQEIPNAGRIFTRIATLLVLGFGLTHGVRFPIRRWGWRHLGWRALLLRMVSATAILALFWACGHLLLDQMLGREPWTDKFTSRGLFFTRWAQGLPVFGTWMIAYFFYHLSDSLTRSELERFQLMANAKEAELRALKSQVNPHFIFNSLNSLRALIEEDPARARSAVTRLAGLLRYALQSGQHETVPLEDELRIVNDYLALEQVRFEDRLRVRLDAAPDTLALPVPPLLLQTLVENAVKYGIATRPEGGEISIRTRRDGDILRLEVSNPGSLAPTVPGDDGSTGLGIRNAAERLRLLFGDGASLQVGATPEAGVLAAAAIPLPHPA